MTPEGKLFDLLFAESQRVNRKLTRVEWLAVTGAFLKSLAKERRKAAVADGAEEVYVMYPKKVGHDDALRAITAALKKHPKEYLLDKTAQFAEAVAGWPSSYRYFQDGGDRCPNPSTWFNQGRFADDPREWRRGGARNPGPSSKSTAPKEAPPDPAKLAQDDADALARMLASPEPEKGTLGHSLWLEARRGALVESVTEGFTGQVKEVEQEQRLRKA